MIYSKRKVIGKNIPILVLVFHYPNLSSLHLQFSLFLINYNVYSLIISYSMVGFYFKLIQTDISECRCLYQLNLFIKLARAAALIHQRMISGLGIHTYTTQ